MCSLVCLSRAPIYSLYSVNMNIMASGDDDGVVKVRSVFAMRWTGHVRIILPKSKGSLSTRSSWMSKSS